MEVDTADSVSIAQRIVIYRIVSDIKLSRSTIFQLKRPDIPNSHYPVVIDLIFDGGTGAWTMHYGADNDNEAEYSFEEVLNQVVGREDVILAPLDITPGYWRRVL